MRTILLATLLLFSGCKKDEAKPAETAEKKAETPAAAPADPAKPAEPAQPADPAKPAEGTAAAKIVNATDYESKAIDMTNKLLAIFVAAGKDCDKLAANVTKFADENRQVFEALKAFEKEHPDAEKAFDEKMKPREKEFEDKLKPAFEACRNHDGMKKAMQSLPMD